MGALRCDEVHVEAGYDRAQKLPLSPTSSRMS